MEINKIYQGDCMELLKTIPDDSIDCVITDPPYNIGKDKWDKVKDYYKWLTEVFKECERVLTEKGTLWFFHISFSDLAEIHKRLIKDTSFRHKQLIIINKGLGSVAGRCNTEVLRSYPRATEYLQFYTFEDITGAEQLSDTYAKKNPMAKYLKEEFKRAGVGNKEIAKLFPSKTGGMTGCVSNWLIGYNFPLKEQYEKMREFLNYEYLRKEYEDLRKEYEDLRYTFNLQLGLTDVWDINFYGESINGHCTVKPISLIRRILQTTTKKNDLVLDPFMGSGTTAFACQQLQRRWVGSEVNTDYVALINKRINQKSLHHFSDTQGVLTDTRLIAIKRETSEVSPNPPTADFS
ncbi:MAG: site-specific DNA-methyltransferase [bacterium]